MTLQIAHFKICNCGITHQAHTFTAESRSIQQTLLKVWYTFNIAFKPSAESPIYDVLTLRTAYRLARPRPDGIINCFWRDFHKNARPCTRITNFNVLTYLYFACALLQSICMAPFYIRTVPNNSNSLCWPR